MTPLHPELAAEATENLESGVGTISKVVRAVFGGVVKGDWTTKGVADGAGGSEKVIAGVNPVKTGSLE